MNFYWNVPILRIDVQSVWFSHDKVRFSHDTHRFFRYIFSDECTTEVHSSFLLFYLIPILVPHILVIKWEIIVIHHPPSAMPTSTGRSVVGIILNDHFLCDIKVNAFLPWQLDRFILRDDTSFVVSPPFELSVTGNHILYHLLEGDILTSWKTVGFTPYL